VVILGVLNMSEIDEILNKMKEETKESVIIRSLTTYNRLALILYCYNKFMKENINEFSIKELEEKLHLQRNYLYQIIEILRTVGIFSKIETGKKEYKISLVLVDGKPLIERYILKHIHLINRFLREWNLSEIKIGEG
jgi:hypothetical protein